jgi:hypothetical protein
MHLSHRISDVDKSTSTVNTRALLQYNRNTDEKREQQRQVYFAPALENCYRK